MGDLFLVGATFLLLPFIMVGAMVIGRWIAGSLEARAASEFPCLTFKKRGARGGDVVADKAHEAGSTPKLCLVLGDDGRFKVIDPDCLALNEPHIVWRPTVQHHVSDEALAAAREATREFRSANRPDAADELQNEEKGGSRG